MRAETGRRLTNQYWKSRVAASASEGRDEEAQRHLRPLHYDGKERGGVGLAQHPHGAPAQAVGQVRPGSGAKRRTVRLSDL